MLISTDTTNVTVTLTQPFLTQKIIDAMDIGHLPPVTTPAQEVLVTDKDGDPPNGVYNYKAICGMLLYLKGHSRPDIGMAVSQVCRFTHCTRRSHEIALERIGQYLKGTPEAGLIMKPTPQCLDIDAYVDTDFAGLALKEERTDPTSVKSRTGFVLNVANCPVTWSSKLQRQIATSSTHAEYIGLSSAMREILPLGNLLATVSDAVGLPEDYKPTFKTTVWEDKSVYPSIQVV